MSHTVLALLYRYAVVGRGFSRIQSGMKKAGVSDDPVYSQLPDPMTRLVVDYRSSLASTPLYPASA